MSPQVSRLSLQLAKLSNRTSACTPHCYLNTIIPNVSISTAPLVLGRFDASLMLLRKIDVSAGSKTIITACQAGQPYIRMRTASFFIHDLPELSISAEPFV